LNSPFGLVFDNQGNLFIADTNNHRIRKVSTTGTITTVAGAGAAGFWGDLGAATAAGLNAPRGVAIDASGNLVVADTGNHVIRKIASDGTIRTIAGANRRDSGSGSYSVNSVAATDAVLSSPSAIAFDGSGQLYIANTGGNALFKVDAAGMVTTVADLSSPLFFAIDNAGSIYVAENGGNRIAKVDPSGAVTVIAGTGACALFGEGLEARFATLCGPSGLTVDPSGNLFITDVGYDRILKIDSRGVLTRLAAGTRYFGDGGSALRARLALPSALATDALGNVYIADWNNSRIRKIAGDGTISLVAGNGVQGASGDGGPAIMASIDPYFLATDASGNLYYADARRIRRINPSGMISTVAGGDNYGYSGDGGPATAASFYGVAGFVIAPTGEIYVSDSYGHRLRKVRSDGIIITVAGKGDWGFSGDGGPASNAYLNFPGALALDPAGNLFIADRGNFRVRRIGVNGIINTVAGGGTGGDNGPATLASISPSALATDGAGNLFIAEKSSNRIRMVSPQGTITTLAGAGWAGFAGDGGASPSALLSEPSALAVAPDGTLCVADRSNHRIRKVTAGSLVPAAGNNQVAPFNSAVTVPLTVQFSDGEGALVAGAAVNYQVVSGTATLGSRTAMTDTEARARVSLVVGPTAEVITVRADAANFVRPATFTATAVAGPPPSISIASGTNQTGVVGGNLPRPLVVSAVDSANRAIAGLVVSFAVSSAPVGADGMTVTSSCTTDSSGQCQVILKLGSVAGAYTVTASANDSGGNALANSPLQFQASAIVGRYYLVGDVFPTPSVAGDLNGDGDYYDAGEFGDGSLTILDLIYALRAVTNVPGFRPPSCSDRFDAIDSFPKDTESARGGDGILNTVDLIYTLRRVTNVDTARPQRLQRTGPCGSQAPGSSATMAARAGGNEAGISGEFGAGVAVGHSLVRVPLFLQLTGESNLAGLSLAVGMSDGQAGARLRFVPADGVPAPSLIDGQLPGVLALAWLDSLRLPDSRRVLLGYVEVPAAPAGVSLRFYGASANTTDGSELWLTLPAPSSSLSPR
jgi:sugar lactone lactonase YvrE